MRIWEVEFVGGNREIIFAPNRRHIWNKYVGVVKIHEVVIH